VTDEFIRKQYDHEVQRQGELVSSLSLPFGILTVLGSAAASMIQGFSYTITRWTEVFYGLAGLDVVAFVIAVLLLIRAFFGQTYEYLPRLSDLNAYHQGLVAYYVGQGHTEVAAKQLTDQEFETYLAGKMIQAATRNAISNDGKSASRHDGNRFIFVVLALTGLMIIPYAWDKRYAVAKIPAVHVDNLDSTLRDLQNGRNDNNATSGATGAAGASREASATGEPGGERGNGRDGEGSADRGTAKSAGSREDGAPVVSGDRPTPPPAQNPPPRPVPPDNTEVRTPRPGTTERR
jgi:hypothetical protein